MFADWFRLQRDTVWYLRDRPASCLGPAGGEAATYPGRLVSGRIARGAARSRPYRNVRNGLEKIGPAKDNAEVMGAMPVPGAKCALGRLRCVRLCSAAAVKPVPVPERAGEPSSIEHVVYIIKENKTYDQVLGDIGKGNSEPKLCVLGREITPNHHALAEQFVLLDNYYCNGVLSADGHQWATQGYATDYLEKAFGGFPRSYPYTGDDPLRSPRRGLSGRGAAAGCHSAIMARWTRREESPRVSRTFTPIT